VTCGALPRASAACAVSSQPRQGRTQGWLCLRSDMARPLLVCAGWRAGRLREPAPAWALFVSVLARPGLGFPGRNVFIAPFVLKAGLWLTHINSLEVHCCCTAQHLGNQENSRDGATDPASPRRPSPALLSLPAAARHLPSQQQAGCSVQIRPGCCHHHPAPGWGCGLDRGQGAPSHSWSLPAGAGGAGKGAPVPAEAQGGPRSHAGWRGRHVMTSQRKCVVGAGLCLGCVSGWLVWGCRYCPWV